MGHDVCFPLVCERVRVCIASPYMLSPGDVQPVPAVPCSARLSQAFPETVIDLHRLEQLEDSELVEAFTLSQYRMTVQCSFQKFTFSHSADALIQSDLQ